MTIYGSSGRKAKYFHLLLSEVLCNLDVEAVLGLDLDDLLGDALAGLLKQGFSGKFSKTGEAVKVKNVFTGRDRTGRRTSEYVLILDWYHTYIPRAARIARVAASMGWFPSTSFRLPSFA